MASDSSPASGAPRGTTGEDIKGQVLDGQQAVLAETEPLRLDSGGTLGPITVAYTTQGHLNPARTNAILICHALTGDQFVSGIHPTSGKPMNILQHALHCENFG